MKSFSMGRLGRLFLNAVTLESRSPGSVVVKIRKTTDPGTLRAAKHSRMTSFYNGKKPSICFGGFTLIELLVVVLIIGILSAIALPQYRVAVERARVVKALPVLRSIMDARERTFLANGSYSTDLEDLDIGISYTSKHDYGEGTEYDGTPIGYFRLPKDTSCVFAGLDILTIDFCPNRKECYSAGVVGERVCASLGKKSHVYKGVNYYKLDF